MRSGLASADLVRADTTRDPVARDRERRRLRQRGLHRAHDAVLEDHTRILCRSDGTTSEFSLPCGAVKKPLLLLAAVLAAVVASSAYAITYGQYDGNGHPNVGAMLRLSPTTGNYRIVCTGSLISPTVYLTASPIARPSSRASRPATRTSGHVRSDGSTPATLPASAIHGTMYTNPLYNQRASDPEDIAVIVLDHPVTGSRLSRSFPAPASSTR